MLTEQQVAQAAAQRMEPRAAIAAQPHKRRAVFRRQRPLKLLERAEGSRERRPRSRTTHQRGAAGASSGAGWAAHGRGWR
eukprot:1169954-Prymnesium_polylepis.1